MVVSRNPAVRVAREEFYASRGVVAAVAGHSFTFYPGQPANPSGGSTLTQQIVRNANQQQQGGGSTLTQQIVRNTYLVQVLLGNLTSSLDNGIGPVRSPQINMPTIALVATPVFAGETVTVTVTYNEPDVETDIIGLFLPGTGLSIKALSLEETSPGVVEVTFPNNVNYPAGAYTLRVMREESPSTGFSVRTGAVVFT